MIYVGNRYEIIEEIGRSSNSCLYKGRDSNNGEFVMISILDKGIIRSDRFISNLIDEATSVNEINSPSILKIKNVGMEEHSDKSKMYYIISEYMQGSTLSELSKMHKLELDEIIIILRQVLNALDVIHSYDIYHGYLQPSNIIIDEGYNVKLSNIGIIKANNKIFNNGIKLFNKNFKYMCPHQVCLGYTDKSSDFYALGIIMFELIFGKHPYGDTSNKEEIIKKMDKGINWDKIDDKNIPPKIKIILKKLLSRNDRYKTPKEVIIDLSDYLYEVENIEQIDEDIKQEKYEEENINEKNFKRNKKGIFKFSKIAVIGFILIFSCLVIGITIK